MLTKRWLERVSSPRLRSSSSRRLHPCPLYLLKMSEPEEYCCFIGSLSGTTTDGGLKEAFQKFGHLTKAKVILDKFSGRSRGFGFVTFDEKEAMEEAIEAMNGMDLDGQSITVERAQPHGHADEVQMVVTVLNVGSLVILQENALLVMVQEEIGTVAEMTGMGVVVAVITDMDLTGMGTTSLHGTEMEEAVGAQEVIDIIVIGLVHMIGLVEVAAATELDHIASVTGCCCLGTSVHVLDGKLLLLTLDGFMHLVVLDSMVCRIKKKKTSEVSTGK
ncbi:hypothetical protein OPV22_029864 [Ensete ventricosum]|uniref:RRM domain-containing protein n=1 Tax=Ensete ventricosum TaxID=4639 RepID=A0AAV8P5I2_ENSVE|nr:hypothetical protein OPV22_029864 [Ensete ventricosum]